MAIYVLLAYFIPIPILNDKQQIMFALFATSLFLWISETVPNYVTSMILICGLVLTGILKSEAGNGNLGRSGYLVERCGIYF